MLFELGELEQLIEEAAMADETQSKDEASSMSARREKKKHGRRIIPDNLPTEVILHELPEEQGLYPIDGKLMPAIRDKTSEQQDLSHRSSNAFSTNEPSMHVRQSMTKILKEWFKELDSQPEFNRKRRDSIQWMYDLSGRGSDVWWPTTIWVEYEKVLGIVNRKDGRAEGFNICSTKSVTATIAEIWAAWTSPKSLKAWFGSNVKNSLKEGGAWSYGDGNGGDFLRIRENKDLRFSWTGEKSEAPRLVDVVFADKGKGKTLITLTHQRIQNRPEADGLRNAWSAALDRLKLLIES